MSGAVSPFPEPKGGQTDPEGQRALSPESVISYSTNIPPVEVEWRNLSLRVPDKRQRKTKAMKTILSDVSGKLEVGTLSALMGPTGCGKTTLLNALAGRVLRVKGAEMEGYLLCNGKLRNENHFKRLSAYVTQDDFMYAFLTVKETLTMAANFFMGSAKSKKDKEAHVASVMTELGLTRVSDTIVGNEKVRGVSGGERKRVSIGIELINDPSVLFLDEPTTGLDAFQALSVMTALKALAFHGRTVVAAIHQPRSSIFANFDHLYLLSEGKTVYDGPASDASSYFTQQGFPCPHLFNPADHFLDVCSMDYRTPLLEKDSRARIELLQDKWKEIERPKLATFDHPPQAEEGEGLMMSSSTLSDLCGSNQYKSNWWQQFEMLMWRAWAIVWRNKAAMAAKIGMMTFFGLLLGGIYSNTSLDQKSIHDRIGVLFFVTLNQTFSAVMATLQTFPQEKVIITRERAAHSYRLLPYYLSKMISELPVTISAALIFNIICYWLVGLNPAPDRFFFFLLTGVLESITGVALGIALSAMAPDVESAHVIGPPFMIILVLFGGFYVNVDNLPVGARWVPYISFIKWTFQAFAQNEFAGTKFTCPSSGHCISTGEQVIASLSFSTSSKWIAIIILTGIFVVHNLIAFVVLALNRTSYMTVTSPSSNATTTTAPSTKSSKSVALVTPQPVTSA